MTQTVIRCVTLVAVMAVSISCGGPAPTAPTTQSEFVPFAAPSSRFPPLSGRSRVFSFDRQLTHPVGEFTRTSHVVLFDNGAFALLSGSLEDVLQYGSFARYRGGYT